MHVVHKYILPTTQKSFVICEYKCHCDSLYVERISQRLQNRIKKNVPQWLRQQLTRPRRSQPHRSCKRTDHKPSCDSAIGQHLLDNDQCALNMITSGFQSSPQHAALFILISQRLLISSTDARLYADRKSLFTLSNSSIIMALLQYLASCCSFSNFRHCEIFLWRALQY